MLHVLLMFVIAVKKWLTRSILKEGDIYFHLDQGTALVKDKSIMIQVSVAPLKSAKFHLAHFLCYKMLKIFTLSFLINEWSQEYFAPM